MKIPSAGTPVSPVDLLAANVGCPRVFSEDLRTYLGVDRCLLSGSGTSAFYAILLALKARSTRKEVVLPCYTAPSLVLPIRKAGLVPVLADASLETLNADSAQLLSRVTSRTLAVVPVHMYGLATDVITLERELADSGTTVVEDACSAMGTTIQGRRAGSLATVGFLSFNRGKNLSALKGGVVTSRNEELAQEIERVILSFDLPAPIDWLRNIVLASALALAVRPWGYSALYPLVSRFKYKSLHTDFSTDQMHPYLAGLGSRILQKFERICRARQDRASRLRSFLTSSSAVPVELGGSLPVHNQFPLLLPDARARDDAYRAILGTGLEATLLYPEPIHRIYDSFWGGTGPDPFPNATSIAQRLLLVPTHPLVPIPTIDRVADILISGKTGRHTSPVELVS